MEVSQLLESKGYTVHTVHPDMRVSEAIGALSRYHVSALVVSERGHAIDGLVSEHDIVRGLHLDGPRVLDDPVRSIMATDVMTCSPADRLDDLAVRMTDRRAWNIPVVANGRLVGLVSIGDIVQHHLQLTLPL